MAGRSDDFRRLSDESGLLMVPVPARLLVSGSMGLFAGGPQPVLQRCWLELTSESGLIQRISPEVLIRTSGLTTLSVTSTSSFL